MSYCSIDHFKNLWQYSISVDVVPNPCGSISGGARSGLSSFLPRCDIAFHVVRKSDGFESVADLFYFVVCTVQGDVVVVAAIPEFKFNLCVWCVRKIIKHEFGNNLCPLLYITGRQQRSLLGA